MKALLFPALLAVLFATVTACAMQSAPEVHTLSRFRAFCGVVEGAKCTDWTKICVPFEQVMKQSYQTAAQCQKNCTDMRVKLYSGFNFGCGRTIYDAENRCKQFCRAHYP